MIVGILLAAGESRRFGSPKLLHPLADGTPMALRCAKNLMAAVDWAIAIVSPEVGRLPSLLLNAGVDVDVCTQASDGMGASLACGIRATKKASGWIVALADMPFVQPSTFAAVASALRHGAPIAAPVQDGRRGHPVGFSGEYYAELAALSGDVGAKNILHRDQSRIAFVPVNDPGIHRDVDVPQDLD